MAKDIKDKKIDELHKMLYEQKELLRSSKLNVGNSKVKNVKEQSALKKGIARILTEINSR